MTPITKSNCRLFTDPVRLLGHLPPTISNCKKETWETRYIIYIYTYIYIYILTYIFALLSVHGDIFLCLLHTKNIYKRCQVSAAPVVWNGSCLELSHCYVECVKHVACVNPVWRMGQARVIGHHVHARRRSGWRKCLWDSGIHGSRLISRIWCNSLMVGKYPTACVRIHILVSHLCKNNICICITLIGYLH